MIGLHMPGKSTRNGCGARLCVFVVAITVAYAVRAGMAVDTYDTSVTPGVWCGNFQAAKTYAIQNDIPLVLFWSMYDCHYCEALSAALTDPAGLSWVSQKNAVFCFVEGDGRNHDSGANYNSGAQEFAQSAAGALSRKDYITLTPIICLYWVNRGSVAFTTQPEEDLAKLLSNFKGMYEGFVAKYPATVSCAAFQFGDAEEDRLEAIAGKTDYVDVPVVRTNGTDTVAESAVVMTFPDGSTTNATWSWSVGEERHFVRCHMPNSAIVGDTVTLSLREVGGGELAVRHIWAVAEPENSPKNPYWIGEKTQGELQWGDWTMDLEAAQEKVAAYNAKKSGDRAYMVVLMAGELWCPDCNKTDKNLFDIGDFKTWAASRKVVFGVVDLPGNPQDASSVPSLLDYRSGMSYYAPYRKSGAGYLSRKMADPSVVEWAVARNKALAGNDATGGGYNTPDRVNSTDPNPAQRAKQQARPGVPILITLRDDGTTASRFTRFATTSPTAYNPVYLTRLDEMLALVDDPVEEANDDHRTTGEIISPVKTNIVSATLSASDRADTYLLEGFDDGTIIAFSVSGAANAPLSVSLVDCETGMAEVSTNGFAASGITLSAKLGASAKFLKVASGSDDSGNPDLGFFGYTSATSTVCEYSIAALGKMGGGEVGFDPTAISVVEEGAPGFRKNVPISVSRFGGKSGAVQVRVHMVNPPEDGRIEWTDATLTWADGESGIKTANLFIVGDDQATGDLELSFELVDFIAGKADAEASDAALAEGRGVLAVHVADDDVFGTLVYRNVAYRESVDVADWQAGDAVQVCKTSGSLPSGLTLKIVGGSVVVSGAPTRNGENSATYAVSVMRGGMKVAMQEIAFDFTVRTLNASSVIPSLSEMRTYSNLPFVDDDNTVIGLLTLTVPPSGRLSARLKDVSGATSFSTGSWGVFDAVNRSIGATLESCSGDGRSLRVTLTGSGGAATLVDGGNEVADVDIPAEVWSSAASAAAWQGQYTVQMPQTNVVDGVCEGRLGGSAYMAMRMVTASAMNRGAMLYAGVLPNGRAVYGTATLLRRDGVAEMPFYHFDGSSGVGYVFSGSFGISPNAMTEHELERWSVRACAATRWATADSFGHESDFLVYGGYYDKDGISARFAEDFKEGEDCLFQSLTDVLVTGRHGIGEVSAPVRVEVAENVPALDPYAANPQEISLSFSPQTGVVFGELYIPFANGTSIAATYRGIALPGWQGCSRCSMANYVECPWADGACSFADRMDGLPLRSGFRVKMDKMENVEE